ncbi:esterase family protein [Mycolicibacterium sp. P1-5]|nr:esterase family protein [Mycolicibacterium sp. P1-5]
MSGWVPAAVQVIAVVAVAGAVGWRSDLWNTRWLPWHLGSGVVLAGVAHWYIGSIGVAGDSAPWRLWLWIGLTGLAVSVLVTGWLNRQWWRRGVSALAVPLCLLCAALALNAWVGYFPTVNVVWNQLTRAPVPNQTDRVAVTAMQVAGDRPAKGVVVPVTIPAEASKFTHRGELVYLPPAWFAHNPPPRLPVVMMIGAALNTPADWLRAGNAITTVDDFAAAHNGNAPVLVFVDATGAFNNDTECVNGSRGKAADHLTKDVVPFMVTDFGVSADRANWGILGWSMGGTCAVDLTVMHPELFSAFVDIAGDLGPNTGNKAQTISRLFGGNADAWAAFDPTTVITRHGPYTGVSAIFDMASNPQNGRRPDLVGNPEGQDVAIKTLSALASTHGIQCGMLTQPGKHDWPFAAQAFSATLPWLAGQLGTPGVPAVPLPQPVLSRAANPAPATVNTVAGGR